MEMKFPKKTLRLISVRSGTSQKGNPYTFVKLADEATFENNDFMLGKETDVRSLVVQNRYEAELDVEDKFTSINLFLSKDQPQKATA
jgi:hypothetical protein